MTLRFRGSIEELQRILGLNDEGEWLNIGPIQSQFRHRTNGGILNWFPTTGTINFQGSTHGVEYLRSRAHACLNVETTPSASPPPVPVGIMMPAPANGETAVAERPSGKVRMKDRDDDSASIFEKGFSKSEIVIGFVGAVGTRLDKVIPLIEERLKRSFDYSVSRISISRDVIPQIVQDSDSYVSTDEYVRISSLMDAGNEARRLSEDNSVLALGAVSKITEKRDKDENENTKYSPRKAYLISSLKHPDEVLALRKIYPLGFYLIGVYADEGRRYDYLTGDKEIEKAKAELLMQRDENETESWGQKVTDTFHLSDFFVRLDENDDKLSNSIWRILHLLFGDPFTTPTFDEYAMFLAFAASVRSADLSRQVGAVIARDNEILATGANDCPKHGGGLYWPEYDDKKNEYFDKLGGRDYTLGEDSNRAEQQNIIEKILQEAGEAGVEATVVEKLAKVLDKSPIRDLTEYGRVVHAEMEALLSCARNSISARGATLYCTTFPCHNCAKHIIAAGIERVVYIEPYQKSKAEEFHGDSIVVGLPGGNTRLKERLGEKAIEHNHAEIGRYIGFEPFVGTGPRRFIDLFSMKLGSGFELKRKNKQGKKEGWQKKGSKLRLQMLPYSYLDSEEYAGRRLKNLMGVIEENKKNDNTGT